jgi:uncharacterized protein
MGQEKIRAVLDTSVLVSALLFEGPVGRLVPLWREGRFVPVVSKHILVEYLRVLAYPKFGLTADEITSLVEEVVLPFAVAVRAGGGGERRSIVREDPEDDKFLHAAAAGKARFVVSGDRRLLALGEHKGAKIVTAREFLGLPEFSDRG